MCTHIQVVFVNSIVNVLIFIYVYYAKHKNHSATEWT